MASDAGRARAAGDSRLGSRSAISPTPRLAERRVPAGRQGRRSASPSVRASAARSRVATSSRRSRSCRRAGSTRRSCCATRRRCTPPASTRSTCPTARARRAAWARSRRALLIEQQVGHRERDALRLPRPQPARHAERPARRIGVRPAQPAAHHRRPAEDGPLPRRDRGLRHRRDRADEPRRATSIADSTRATNAIGTPTRFAIGVGVNPAADRPGARATALRVEGRGGRGVRDHAAGVRRGAARALPADDRRHRASPSIAGIWPLVSARNAEFLANEVPGVTVPDAVLRAHARGERAVEGARAGRGDRDRARDAGARAAGGAGRASVGAVRASGAGDGRVPAGLTRRRGHLPERAQLPAPPKSNVRTASTTRDWWSSLRCGPIGRLRISSAMREAIGKASAG